MIFLNGRLSAFSILCLTLLCHGCASSDVSRDASGQFNTAYQNAGFAFNNDTHPAQSLENSSQTTKGVLIGGATGALAGSMTSGVGFLPGAAGGAIFGGAIGAYIDSKTTLIDKLTNRGIKVIVLGDQVLIVLPSQSLFNGPSAQMRSTAYSSLDLVAQLINGYVSMSVNIAAYTNATGCKPFDDTLSQQQAENVMKYLWRRGVNTRLLHAEGMGDSHPVEMRGLTWNSGENYRVEITLEKLPA
jgi:outer membrane protein OmpA-like peptidoglycan-associated protein